MNNFSFLLLFITTCSLLITVNSSAQTPDWLWAKSASGTGDDYVAAVTGDEAGDVITVGNFVSPSLLVGGTTFINANSGYTDMYIVKYDGDGNIKWAQNAGGTESDYAQSVAVDHVGNIYAAGYFRSNSITFGSFTLINTDPPFSDLFLVKYDSLGNVVWAKSASNNFSTDAISSITTNSAGYVYAVGQFQNATITFGTTILTNATNIYADIFVVKYDDEGNVIWAKSAGGTDNDIANAVSADSSGNVWIAGNFQSSSLAFDTTTLINALSPANDVFIAMYDSAGSQLWAKRAGGGASEYALTISSDKLGNAYAGGYFRSDFITFDTITLMRSDNFYADPFIVKIGPSGTVAWAKSGIGSNSYDAINSICANADGSIYATGDFQSETITFGTIILTNFYNLYQDIFLVKLDSSGNAQWGKSNGGGDHDAGIAVWCDQLENVYVAGNFHGPTLTFGSSTLQNDYHEHYDAFFAKLSNITGIKNTVDSNIIYPNPSWGNITIQFPRSQKFDVAVFDIDGTKIFSEIHTGSGNYNIDLSKCRNGMYLLKVISEENIYLNRIIIEK